MWLFLVPLMRSPSQCPGLLGPRSPLVVPGSRWPRRSDPVHVHLARVLRAADEAFGPKVPNELFFQYSTRLNKEATVNGLVGHAQALVLGILDL